MNIKLIIRIIGSWVIVCSIILIFIVNKKDKFYTFGPNENLIFIGITINTKIKYFLLILYCFFNTTIRSLNNCIIQPWIVLNIENPLMKEKINNAHEIVSLNLIYTWFDWFIYINLLLLQIDMVIIEIISELIIKNLITWKYNVNKINKIECNKIEENF